MFTMNRNKFECQILKWSQEKNRGFKTFLACRKRNKQEHSRNIKSEKRKTNYVSCYGTEWSETYDEFEKHYNYVSWAHSWNKKVDKLCWTYGRVLEIII